MSLTESVFDKFFFLIYLVPLTFLVINLILMITIGRKIHRIYLLRLCIIMKYAMIPYYVFGGFAILACIVIYQVFLGTLSSDVSP